MYQIDLPLILFDILISERTGKPFFFNAKRRVITSFSMLPRIITRGCISARLSVTWLSRDDHYIYLALLSNENC